MLGRVFGNLYGAIGLAAGISYVFGGLLLEHTNARVVFIAAGGRRSPRDGRDRYRSTGSSAAIGPRRARAPGTAISATAAITRNAAIG